MAKVFIRQHSSPVEYVAPEGRHLPDRRARPLTPRRVLVAAALMLLAGTLQIGCATAPEHAPIHPQKAQAPWAGLTAPEFRNLLASYGAAHLSAQRDETLDRYLRSQTKSFDRYIAAKEVGVGVEPLKQEAVAEIQSASAELPTKLFMLRTSFSVSAYDPKLGGFPIYQQPFDLDASLHVYSEDTRTSISTDNNTRGMRVIAKDYGFSEAQIWFSKVGWFVPAPPDQAARVLESLSKSGGERRVSVVVAYSLGRCDPSTADPSLLVCKTNIRSMYVADPMRPDGPAISEMVNRG